MVLNLIKDLSRYLFYYFVLYRSTPYVHHRKLESQKIKKIRPRLGQKIFSKTCRFIAFIRLFYCLINIIEFQFKTSVL